MTPRPDIYTVRPKGESPEDSKRIIKDELKAAGLNVYSVEEGITQPDGSIVYYAFLKEDETEELIEKNSEYRD